MVPGVALWRAAGSAVPNTPPARDRVVDLLRVGSLLIVVFGHILMAVVTWRHGIPTVGNLLAMVPELKIATWALQVMPLFFAAGAISNRLSYASASARGEPWRTWLWHRVRRLIRPVLFYLAIWIPLVFLLEVTLPDAAAPLGKLSTQLLWFLGVYLFVIATTRWQIRLAEIGFPAVVALLAIIALIDVGRFHVTGGIAVANFLLVWFMAATFGLVVRDHVGRGTRGFVCTALGALSLNVALVALLPYPISMIGMPGEPISNMAPPTLVLALHAVVLISLVGIAWPSLERLSARPRWWQMIVAGGAAAMTVYLWHLTALVGITVLEHEIGFGRGPVDDIGFWLATPLHTLAILATTLIVVSVVVVFEHRPVPWLERPGTGVPANPAWSVAAAAGAVACGCGFLVLAATGMAGFPFGRVTTYAELPLTPGLGFALLIVGVLAVRAGGRRSGARAQRPRRRPSRLRRKRQRSTRSPASSSLDLLEGRPREQESLLADVAES